MDDTTRILFVTQEMEPYLVLSEIADLVNKLPKHCQEKGMEIRVLMPRFGVINERRHRLHEVVRLSGMNIIVDDDDYPLIIKVASLPGARLQVYFLDNEEFFKRKFIFKDEKEVLYEDNQDRMVFFCKGVLETVRKFGWPPNLIHCHGWMTSLIPMYVHTVYKNDPIFRNTKVIYSVYNETIEDSFDSRFKDKATINNLEPSALDAFFEGDKIKLHKGGIHYADALIKGSNSMDSDVQSTIEKSGKPTLDYTDGEDVLDVYFDFYNQLI
jgi:starch synthase